MIPSKCKIFINNRYESKRIQQILSNRGYRWLSGDEYYEPPYSHYYLIIKEHFISYLYGDRNQKEFQGIKDWYPEKINRIDV